MSADEFKALFPKENGVYYCNNGPEPFSYLFYKDGKYIFTELGTNISNIEDSLLDIDVNGIYGGFDVIYQICTWDNLDVLKLEWL